MRKNRFLYSHDYRDIKMEGKKSAKQFLKIDTNSASENCWEKKPEKMRKKGFLYSHDYRDQKLGGRGKTRETIFPETQE